MVLKVKWGINRVSCMKVVLRMAKKAGKAGVNKTEMTKNYVAKHPAAGLKEIVEALNAEGVTISRSLAGKIKYGPSTAKKGHRPKRSSVRASSQTASGAERGSKAEAIRSAAKSLGKKVRPRDVIAMLQEQGITVTSAQVSTTLKKMGMRRTRGGKPQIAVAAMVRNAPTSSDRVLLDDLLAAKRLVEKLGGIEQAKTAISALAKLS
jgi:arginine repressor